MTKCYDFDYIDLSLLDKNSIVYSFGIKDDITFEKTIINKTSCQVFCFDSTLEEREWIEEQENLIHPNLNFLRYDIANQASEIEYLSQQDGDVTPKDTIEQDNIKIEHSSQVHIMSFLDITKKMKHSKVELVKLDIEGAEYEIIPSILQSNIEVTQIIVKFHDRLLRGSHEEHPSLTNSIIALLDAYGYTLLNENKITHNLSFIKNSIASDIINEPIIFENFAPVILFCYNRIDVLRNVIRTLKNNFYASKTDLYIYSDGPKVSKQDNIEKVILVRKFLKTINGFKSISIIERIENMGLSQSVINGISEVSQKFDRFIVLEDDILSSPFFIKYMNDALNKYQEEKNVWSINAMTEIDSIESLELQD